MPASRQSRYKERYDKLLDDSLAVVQPRDFSSEELAQTAEDAFIERQKHAAHHGRHGGRGL